MLVFCGSKMYPFRGYIDAVASHNLGQPMNASTFSDMTLFRFGGLSQEGAANVLPVALDHIMHPLIQDSHFATEVYHIDRHGRQQGVVLSEMSDFAYKERSVRSLSLRQMLYAQSSTYAWECGGLPQSIETLTTEEVVRYHREFYNYNNLTLLLVGAYDKCPTAIFDALGKLDAEIVASAPSLKRPMPPPRTKRNKRRNDVLFASDKAQTGSMGFAWEGPPIEDVEAHIALDMFIDYMKNDPASPLRKRFTNRPVPIAGDIDFILRPYLPSMIELSFSEVPFNSYASHAAAAVAVAATKHRSVYDSTSYSPPTDAFGPLDLSKLHDDLNGLFASNYYRKQLVSTLTYIADQWLCRSWTQFHSYIVKRNAFLATTFAKDAMEPSNPQGILLTLARDSLAHHCSPESLSKDKPIFGSRGKSFSLRKSLESKDHVYWKTLVQKWFLDGQMVHLAMIPDPKMSIQIEAEQNLARRYRMENMNANLTQEIEKKLAEALESTKINIPSSVLAALPPTPDIANVQMPSFAGYNFKLGGRPMPQLPFGMGRVLTIPGESKARFQVSLPLAGLSSDLRPYLPLFSKLLTSSVGLVIPRSVAELVSKNSCFAALQPTEMPMRYLHNEQVDSTMDRLFTECKATIGDSNQGTNCGIWPIEVLTLHGSMQSSDLQCAFRWFVLKLLFGDFGVDAILKAATKHKAELQRAKGTGNSLLIDTFPWLRIPGPLDARTIAGSAKDAEYTLVPHRPAEKLGRAINLYYQAAFLSSLTASLSAGMAGDDLAAATQTDRVSDAIVRIRAHFASCVTATGLVHITLPDKQTGAEAREVVDMVVSEWTTCVEAWRQNHQVIAVPDTPYEPSVYYRIPALIHTPPRKRRRSSAKAKHEAVSAVPEKPSDRAGSCEFVKTPTSLGVYITLPNLQTSYLGIQVPLNTRRDPKDTSVVPFAKQLEGLPATDIYALNLLANFFNRSEGPVKNAIRGRGYAYGVGIHSNFEDGNLAVYVSHAVNPQKALEAFWEVLEDLRSEEGWSTSIDQFQLNAAKSIFYYRLYTRVCQSLAAEDAAVQFRGYSGLEELLLWTRKHVESIQLSDLRRVFLRYFVPFISKDSNALYIVTTPQAAPDSEAEFLHHLNGNAYSVDFKAIPFSSLDPVVKIYVDRLIPAEALDSLQKSVWHDLDVEHSEQIPFYIVLVDGILLFHDRERSSGGRQPQQQEHHPGDACDAGLFIYASYATLKERREARLEYSTKEGIWTDPPGYFDSIVWPNFVKYHSKFIKSYPQIAGSSGPRYGEAITGPGPLDSRIAVCSSDAPAEEVLKSCVKTIVDEWKRRHGGH
ncbi:hypothetical protein GGI12_003869 [Dipsacomyces acuminosporus]|nr:hypothetical protein GGI12_003869 [Dipsacomyces acuminosporus]